MRNKWSALSTNTFVSDITSKLNFFAFNKTLYIRTKFAMPNNLIRIKVDEKTFVCFSLLFARLDIQSKY